MKQNIILIIVGVIVVMIMMKGDLNLGLGAVVGDDTDNVDNPSFETDTAWLYHDGNFGTEHGLDSTWSNTGTYSYKLTTREGAANQGSRIIQPKVDFTNYEKIRIYYSGDTPSIIIGDYEAETGSGGMMPIIDYGSYIEGDVHSAYRGKQSLAIRVGNFVDTTQKISLVDDVTLLCSDECTFGEQRCASGNQYEVCGNFDADSCAEWGTVVDCGAGETCTDGECRECNTDADTDCDSIITTSELQAYGQKWLLGQITRTDIGQAIQAWAG